MVSTLTQPIVLRNSNKISSEASGQNEEIEHLGHTNHRSTIPRPASDLSR